MDEWVGNARNGIPRSQLRSHPDLTRPYSGLIVIAFCLFARRKLPSAAARPSFHGRSHYVFVSAREKPDLHPNYLLILSPPPPAPSMNQTSLKSID